MRKLSFCDVKRMRKYCVQEEKCCLKILKKRIIFSL